MPSIWSKFRTGKVVADQALAKHAGLEPDSQQSSPAVKYRHIPRHAQSDAIIGPPGCYKEIDRRAIKQQAERRGTTPIDYGTYQKTSLASCRTSWGDGDGRPMTERRMSKCIDSGVGSTAPSSKSSVRSGHVKYSNGNLSSGSSSSQEDLPTMKRQIRPRSSFVPDSALPMITVGREGRPAYTRAPQSIKLDTTSVCERLQDNPNPKVGEAPILAVSPLDSRQIPPVTADVPTEKAKTKKSWGFGKRKAGVSASGYLASR